MTTSPADDAVSHPILDGRFSSLELDVARSRAAVHLTDGRSAWMPLTTPMAADGAGIVRMIYSLAERTLTIATSRGEHAVMEIAAQGDTSHPGRHVAYLDQCHWSTLARRAYDPGSVTNRNNAVAADKLIEWARAHKIVLPLSSGHVMETTPLYGEKRQQLAITMLQLSRGWHMRNPLLVRRDEIGQVLDNASGGIAGRGRPQVFTLDPDSLYATSSPPAPDPAGLLDYLDWLFARLTAVAANFALLMDPEHIAPEKTSGWSNALDALGSDAGFQAMPAARRRIAAQARALTDAIADLPVLTRIQDSGLSTEDAVNALLQGLQAPTDTMPFLRLYADALSVRLLNRARWEPNDLVDMLYLSCAAAYADGVAAERTAARYLDAAWRGRPGPCPVMPTLHELVAHLTDLGLE